MARWFPVLFMLFAQITAMFSPILLRHCVSADGQHFIELQNQDCQGCVFSLPITGHSEIDDHSHEHDTAKPCCGSCTVAVAAADDLALASEEVGVTIREGCDCEHSQVEHLHLLVRQADLASQLVGATLRDVTVRSWAASSAQTSAVRHLDLRPDPDAHLAVMAVVELRV